MDIIESKNITEFPIRFQAGNITKYYIDLDVLNEEEGGINYEK